ncbi:lipoate--protein ligase family protein [Spirulina sp. CS-785/01]|uniref:lipoate--protein ligase family protein n=1 Tax=Spirulina sp. CS-785/01 TaxID=3021716 RepID=UPI003FA683BE
MAIDRWLLKEHRLGQHPPTLRFYTWSPVAISLGYHQRHYPAEWHHLTWEGQPVEVVRRPTGGRAVLHQGDLTYMLVTSGLSGKRSQVYQTLCQFLLDGWQKLGIPLEYGTAKRGYIHNPSCFGTATAADLVTPTGAKLIGSAQLRQGKAILQHGSMILQQSPDFYQRVFGEATHPVRLPPEITMKRVIDTLSATLAQQWGMTLDCQPLTPQEWETIHTFWES